MPNFPGISNFNVPTVVGWEIYLEDDVYIFEYVIYDSKVTRKREWSGTVDELCKFLLLQYIECMDGIHKLGGKLSNRDIWRIGLTIKYDNGFIISADGPGYRTNIEKAPLLLEQVNGAIQRYNKLKIFF